MLCMQIKYSKNENWLNFYDQIEGFTYEPGYDYELQVMTSNIPNPPMDASSIKYELVKVISKVATNGS